MRPLLATVLFLGISFHLNGQTSFRDTSEVYHYWAKRGIIEMIYAYMEDVESQDTNDRKGQDNYKIKFIDNIDQKDKSQIDQDFENLLSFLRSNYWPTTAEQILIPLRNNYQVLNSIDNTFFQINGSGHVYREKGLKCYQTQAIVISEYRAAKQSVIGKIVEEVDIIAATPSEISSTDSNVVDPDIQTPVGIRSKMILFCIVFFLVGIITSYFSIYFIFKKQIHYILCREKEKYLSELHTAERYFPKWLGMIEVLKKNKDQYKKEMQMVNNQSQLTIDNLKKKLIELVQENETIKAKLNTDKEEILKSHTDNLITPTTSSKFKTVFFSLPDDGGRFKVENGKKHNDGNNFYKIEHEENNSYGILHFISSDLDQRAIERIQGYLLPVCEIVNFSDRIKASKIKVLTSGKVIIKNDHWVVDPNNKIKIKLI